MGEVNDAQAEALRAATRVWRAPDDTWYFADAKATQADIDAMLPPGAVEYVREDYVGTCNGHGPAGEPTVTVDRDGFELRSHHAVERNVLVMELEHLGFRTGHVRDRLFRALAAERAHGYSQGQAARAQATTRRSAAITTVQGA